MLCHSETLQDLRSSPAGVAAGETLQLAQIDKDLHGTGVLIQSPLLRQVADRLQRF